LACVHRTIDSPAVGVCRNINSPGIRRYIDEPDADVAQKHQDRKKNQGRLGIDERDEKHARNAEEPSQENEGLPSKLYEIINHRAPDELEHPGDVDEPNGEGGDGDGDTLFSEIQRGRNGGYRDH